MAQKPTLLAELDSFITAEVLPSHERYRLPAAMSAATFDPGTTSATVILGKDMECLENPPMSPSLTSTQPSPSIFPSSFESLVWSLKERIWRRGGRADVTLSGEGSSKVVWRAEKTREKNVGGPPLRQREVKRNAILCLK